MTRFAMQVLELLTILVPMGSSLFVAIVVNNEIIGTFVTDCSVALQKSEEW
jgi:hypothetical protein